MKITKYILGLLVLAAISVWAFAFQGKEDEYLHLIACDVGQGDAILVVYGNYQVLVDGGPDERVISCLDRHISPLDREIELIILTHPDKDHYGGLKYVFERYKVINYFTSGLESGNDSYQVLKSTVGSGDTRVENAVAGQQLGLGLIHLDIYNPINNNIANSVLGADTEKADTNENSVVLNLAFGSFDAVLAGDLPPDAGKRIIDKYLLPDVEYIKVSHHGSRNGLDENLLLTVKPDIAVISVGKNSYGHPHQEVLQMLQNYGVRTLRTDEMGDVEVITDGNSWWVKGEK
jgi:competence protein ComEC